MCNKEYRRNVINTRNMLQKPKILRVFWNVMPHSFLDEHCQPNPTNYLASNRARSDEAVILLIPTQGAQFESPPGHQLS
jgi:hypothetical protein